MTVATSKAPNKLKVNLHVTLTATTAAPYFPEASKRLTGVAQDITADSTIIQISIQGFFFSYFCGLFRELVDTSYRMLGEEAVAVEG